MKGKLTLHSEYILKKFTDDVPHLNLHTFLRNNLSPWKKKTNPTEISLYKWRSM